MRFQVLANVSALLAAVLFGLSIVATRVAVQEIPPLTLALLRSGQGGLLLLVGLLLVARSRLRVVRRDLPFLALLGALLFAAFPATYNLGFRWTEASRGALVLASIPAWAALLSRFLNRERLAARQLLGVGLAFAGLGLVLAERGLTWWAAPEALAGDAVLIVTALCQAAYTVLARRLLGRYHPLTVATYAMLLGSLLLVPLAATENAIGLLATLGPSTVPLVLFLGIFGGAVGYALWTAALVRLTSTQVAVYINLALLVAILLGVVLLSEPLSGRYALGFAAVSAGVLLVNWPRRNQSDPPPGTPLHASPHSSAQS